MFNPGQLVTTNLRAAGGWIIPSKTLYWKPLKMGQPYIVIEIKYTQWAVNKIAVLLAPEGYLIEVILDVLTSI